MLVRSFTLAFAALAGHVAGDATFTIDSKSDRGLWEGWGTSLAWWARTWGDRDDLADIFFSNKTTQSAAGVQLPGLSFNIARHNAGACSWNTINGESMVVSPNIMPTRQIEGHWLNWDSEDPSSSSWDWTVDANQRSMLQKAKARGANRFELFSNAPMWWMLYNHNPSGGSNDGENITPWNVQSHALYLATIAKYAKEHWGIEFESIGPFNEPSGYWWRPTGQQEGCHIDVETQEVIINHLRAELRKRELTNTFISASDESKTPEAVDTLKNLGGAKHIIKRVNVHGYSYTKGDRDELFGLASSLGLKVWNSEYGDDDASGEGLVVNLLLDFQWLRPTGWVYWQVLDAGGWGLIDADNEANRLGEAHQKYFVLAQFSRHIREGMKILGGADNVVAGYDSTNQKLVIVAINWDEPQYINFDLSKFTQGSTDGARVVRWRTQVGSSGDRYVEASDTVMSGTSFRGWFETKMVQTFEVPNVLL